MVNMFPEVAASRDRSGLGAVLSADGVAAARLQPASADVLARPRAYWATGASGPLRTAQVPAPGQRNPQKYPHTTRIVAPIGGASGPHSARDPV